MDDRVKQWLTLGREHYGKHELDKAEHYLRQVLDNGCRFADVLDMLGVIRHDRADFDSACELFEEALKINPGYTEAALNLAVTYNDLGRYDDARRVYENAMVRGRAAGGTLDPYVRGKIANLHAEVSQAYVDVGMISEAMHELRKAVIMCPHFADLRTRLAHLYRQQGDLAAARFELEEALTHRPTYTPAHVALGVTRLASGDTAGARAAWARALEIDPTDKAAGMYLRMTPA
jgi:tetratricopeptide (TPR) repeat protein